MCTSASGVASDRMPGIDIARALAVLGMVLVNFRAAMGAHHAELPGMAWGFEQIEGKAAALFLLLAGVGIALRSRRARLEGGAALGRERRALVERAFVLLVVGLLHVHIWRWDILHFYGIYLALAAGLLALPGRRLALAGVVFAIGGLALQCCLDWGRPTELWSWSGATSKLLFNGNYPVFPWMTFLVVGLAVGRLDLRRDEVRRPLLVGALLVFGFAEGLDALTREHAWLPAAFEGDWADWLRTWPRPARPGFVVSGTAAAIATICLCVGATQRRRSARWVVALATTGQMAFTLYLAHTIAVLVPLQHGAFAGASIEVAFVYGLTFFAAAIALSVWWRRRWPHGPLEGLIRQITGRRDTDGPWSGQRLR